MAIAKDATIDSLGRVVIPKAVRELAGFRPEVPLTVRYRDGRVEIEVKPAQVQIVTRGRLRVAVPADSLPPLPAGVVEQTRGQVRESRG